MNLNPRGYQMDPTQNESSTQVASNCSSDLKPVSFIGSSVLKQCKWRPQVRLSSPIVSAQTKPSARVGSIGFKPY